MKESNALSLDTICRLYKVEPEDVVANMYFEPALAYKFTLRRSGKRLQGSIEENDIFGTQQHAPLLDVEIPDQRV